MPARGDSLQSVNRLALEVLQLGEDAAWNYDEIGFRPAVALAQLSSRKDRSQRPFRR
jgi:hypothetical protein